VSGNGDNPLKKVHYYSEPSSPRYTNIEPETPMKKGFTIDINSTSFIIPEKFQERILRLYTFSNNIEEAKKYWKTIVQQYH